VNLALSAAPASHRQGARGCCTLEDARDARRVADLLEIPFYVWDLAERFAADVVEDFVAGYARGETPNPCLRCNERIKFAAVLDRARALGFERVVTGHYARLSGGVLRRGVDLAKDQSYVLAGLRPDQLAGAIFPCGDSTKAQVRSEAAVAGLLVAEKPDSHDVCFVPDGDTAGYLRRRLGEASGQILDVEGSVVGSHRGAYTFTVGQRRGLALAEPAADGRPRYVLEVSPVTRTVTVGPAQALEVDSLVGVDPLLPHGEPDPATVYEVQLRAHGEPLPGRVELSGGELLVSLRRPAFGVARGQAVVVYRGEEVFASATLREARRASAGG
ncbi:MAG: tRNA 2-thiouridine(34) synthase MnmA, partial [Mycobacteriales bacterium]